MNNLKPTPTSALRLWQLISPALPVGAYAYSQGLESACEFGWVSNQESAKQWICGVLNNAIANLDIPVFKRLYLAWQETNLESVHYWNEYLLASRESMEIKKEDLQLGHSLQRLLLDLGELDKPFDKPSSYANLFAYAAQHWHIPPADAAQGYCWSWCENQVAAAIKLIPLGQTAGQTILSQTLQHIPQAVKTGLELDDENLGSNLPGLAIGSALHEIQYSRLFRS